MIYFSDSDVTCNGVPVFHICHNEYNIVENSPRSANQHQHDLMSTIKCTSRLGLGTGRVCVFVNNYNYPHRSENTIHNTYVNA